MQTSHCKNYCLLICVLMIVVQVVVSCQTDHKTAHPVLLRAERLMSERPDSALLLLEDSIDASELSGKNYADWCLLLTQARDKEYVVHTSDSLIRVALAYYEDGKDPERLMLTWYYMGRVSQELNDAVRAQEYYLKALEAGKLSDDIALKARICSNLGMLYNYQSAYDIALVYLQDGLTFLQQTGDTISQSFILRDIGRTYRLLGDLDKSLVYYRKALTCTHSDNQTSILNEIGSLLALKGEYTQALSYIRTALQTIRRDYSYEPVYLTIGKVFYEMDQLDSARFYLHKAQKSNQLTTKSSSYYHLSNISKKEKKYEESILLREQYETLRDSLQQQTYTETIQQMQAMFDYRQNRQEAEIYKLRYAVTQRNYFVAVLIGFLLFTGLACITFYLLSRKRKWKKQELHYQEFIEKQEQALLKQQQSLSMEEFVCSDIYQLFQTIQNKDKGRPTITERKEYEKGIDHIFPDFYQNIRTLYPDIRYEQQFICYLIKGGFSPARMACITHTSLTNIAMIRKRLHKSFTGKEGSAEDFDKLIASV